MSNIAIRVENLGKKYTLGGQKSGSFRENLNNLFSRNVTATGVTARSQRRRGSPPEEFWALKDINFEIKRGEAVGIIGRNGAGKSTLLKILSRITEPTKGRFEVFGRVSSLLEVGTGFHPELTGRENVYLNGTILGMKRREVKAKFDEIVAFSGVEKFIDTPVKHYSSGMQVRLAFAVAAHLEPEILIIDEVLAVGDAEFQKKCLGKMEDVTGQGRTVLFVSHNMDAITRLCSKGIILNLGKKSFEGSITKCVEHYLSIGSPIASYRYINNDSTSFFKQIEILNNERLLSGRLLFGEPFSLTMMYNNEVDLDGLTIVCKIVDSSGRIISVANTLNSDHLNLSKKGQNRICVKFDHNILVPGNYNFEIGAFIRPHTKIEVIEKCVQIEISEIPHDTNYRFNIVSKPIVNLFEKWELAS